MAYDLSRLHFDRQWIKDRADCGEGAGDCWLWRGAKDTKGYGLIARCPAGCGKRMQIKAHRASWLAFQGSQGLNDLCVLHTCDTPACVNPSHLFLGTKTDNAKDRDAKGRGKLWRGKPGGKLFRVGA